MLTIAIVGEICSVCGELLPDRSVAIEELSATSRAKGAVQFSTDPSIMYGNESETIPYVSWHCDDFIKCDNALLSVTCQKCQAEITFSTGIISKCVRKDVDSDYLDEDLPSTFHKWLALQEKRNDRVGDFAREFRDTKKAERQGKISTTAPKNSNDYIAMQEYISRWKNSWADLFQIAWHEFILLRNK